jgi:hypothetical protein
MDGKLKAKETWERFFEGIKHRNRFFIDDDIKTDLVRIINLFNTTLNYGQVLYRARINDKDNNKPYTSSQMGVPHAESARYGRANPAGIPYLYTSTKENTCIAEVRPSLEDLITVGSFKLKKTIKVVNLDDAIPIPENRYFEYLAYYLQVTFSTRVSQERSEIDYVPYQFICELIKVQGFGGVQYRSYMDKDPFACNVVLFDEHSVECTETKLYKVVNVDYSFVES